MFAYRSIFVPLTCISLSGCFSTSFDLFSSEPDANVTRVTTAGPYGKAENALSSKEIAPVIKEYMTEYAEIRPQLNKILSMEQDLAFLIDQMSKLNSLDNKALFISDNSSNSQDFSQVKDMDNLVVNYGNSNPILDNKKVEVGAAPNINKFSDERLNDELLNNSLSGAKDMLNEVADTKSKFSQSTSNMDRQKTIIKPNGSQLDKQKQSGLHLVSVSNKSNLAEFWTNISSQFPTLLNNKQALVENVDVNGTTFYSLRVGPYSEILAKQNCDKLAAEGKYCGVVRFSGTPL